MNTQLAESWEAVFDHWNIDERQVHLGHTAAGYLINLGDGKAYFVLHAPRVGWTYAKPHVEQLLKTLYDGDRKDVRIFIDAQYLLPVAEQSFGDLVVRLAPRLLQPAFPQQLDAELRDFAYMVDLEVEGVFIQVEAGPVRAHEIPRRVSSPTARLGKIPEFALYYSVRSRTSIPSDNFNLDVFWGRVERTGELTRKALLHDNHAR